MRTYTGLIFNKLAHPKADALTLVEDTVVNHCIFDFRNIPLSEQDEIVSGVDGPKVTIRNSLFLGGIKAMLAGNGDHLINDSATARWDLENCVIISSGRRCPEAQDGTIVTMRKCWIHNWGRTFDVRAFGAWAHRGGKILAEDCLFTQSGSLLSLGVKNTALDLVNHIGQAVNDEGLKALLWPKTYRLGITRGLTQDNEGLVLASRCYRNKPWIKIENCSSFMKEDKARLIVQQIGESLHPEYIKYTGMTLAELFDAEVSKEVL